MNTTEYKRQYGYVSFTCIYPGLKAWMERHDWNLTRLAKEANVTRSALSKNLIGITSMSMYTIRQIMSVTGLTFEQAFGEVITVEEARKER